MKDRLSHLILFGSLICFVGCLDIGKKGPDYDKSYRDNEVNQLVGVQLPGTFPDTTKTDGTDNMCWAMVACNTLEYQGHIVDGQACVLDLKDEFGNIPYWPINAYNFYFRELLALDPKDYYEIEYDKVTLLEFVTEAIDLYRPVSLIMGHLAKGRSGHVVAVFGYEYDQGADEYTLFVTDGDDNFHTRFIHVKWNGTTWVIFNSGIYDNFSPYRAISILK